MAPKKRKKPTRKSPRLKREVWEALLAMSRKLVMENPPTTDRYGYRNRFCITWTKAVPRPHSFPLGRLISDVEGCRTLEYCADTVLDWLASKNYTKDTAKSIYALRHYALSSLASMERNLLNIDVKLLDELSVVEDTECSEQNKEN